MGESRRGVAYRFWRKVESERVDQGLTKAELSERSGVARSTIDRLEFGLRPPAVKTVHALADVLHIKRDKAEVLAGLLPDESEPTGEVDVRDAILRSPAYTEDQRAMLLAMVDTIDQANRRTSQNPDINGGSRAM